MLLAINTSTPQFSLALLSREGSIVAEHLMSQGKGHFQNLMPTLQVLLHSAERDIHEVTCISLAAGPGSFTGLRIGISLAKGLCHALRVPVLGVSSLKALAVQVPYADVPVVPLLYSRKGEVFAARFVWDKDRHLTRVLEDTWVRLGDIPHVFHGPTLFVGNDYANQGKQLKAILKEGALLAPIHCWCPRASSVGSLALQRFLDGDTEDPHTLHPIYLRPPDIRPNPFASN